jgi:two-component sensor histidine kinase
MLEGRADNRFLDRNLMSRIVARDLRQGADDDIPIVIAGMPANARQRRIGTVGLVVMAVVVVATLPFVNIELGRGDAFAPIIQAFMCAADLLTAVFLFAQYAIQPQRALLVLASGYVFSGLFALLDALAFPDAYGPGVLFGDGLFTPTWLFIFWHTGFPLAVIAYALLKDADRAGEQSGTSTGATIGIGITCVVLAIAGLTWIATVGVGYLPGLYAGLFRQQPFVADIGIFLALLSTVAIVLLFVRRRTILDEWLIVTLLAWLPNFIVAILFTVVRFTVGWYMSRVYALIAGSSLLFVLLTEVVFLYARLANANRHQQLLIDELDHRVKNVLARVVVAIRHSRQSIGSMEERLEALDGRLKTMADAHSLLSQSRWKGVNLSELVHRHLAPYEVAITGPDTALTPEQTQAVAMVLQELVTNAVKYGALSTPDGRVSVTWDHRPGGDGAPRLAMVWREMGGPPASAPARPGYGTRLIRGLIPHELGGTVQLVFTPGGACCDIEFPLRSPSAL